MELPIEATSERDGSSTGRSRSASCGQRGAGGPWWGSLSRCAGVTAALFLILSPALAGAQLVVLEPGFTVTTLPPGVGAKGIECSPGGIWGDFVYVADSSAGVIERIDFADNVTLFASGLTFPVGMAFGPGPGSNFGDFLYVADFNANAIVKIDPAGVVSAFAAMSFPGDLTFDPTGVYGTDLYATTAFSSPINTIDSAGVSTLFSAISSLYLRFGPGGAFGTGLFAIDITSGGLAKIDVAGVATPFAGGFLQPEGFDWASGTGFGGDMFLGDVSGHVIYRVKSDGSTSVFATLPGAADVAYCNGALYAVSLGGGCYKVTEAAAVAPTLSTPGLAVLLLMMSVAIVLARRSMRRAGRVA